MGLEFAANQFIVQELHLNSFFRIGTGNALAMCAVRDRNLFAYTQHNIKQCTLFRLSIF